MILGVPGASWGAPGEVLGPPGGVLAALGSLGRVLGRLGSVLGPLEGVLGRLGASWRGPEVDSVTSTPLFDGLKPETLYFTRVWEGPRWKVHPRMARKSWFVGRGGETTGKS